MQALFIHGMGRSPLSAWPMLRTLRHGGINVRTFSYFVSLESFDAIAERLATTITRLARDDDYVLIGHSLGGVLARAALARLGAETPLPRHVFLLGSPVRPARLARRLAGNPVYRLVTGDCGQLLASDQRMDAIGMVAEIPATAIVGRRGLPRWIGPFGAEANDSIVAESEVLAGWLSAQVPVPTTHSFLPVSRGVARQILEILRTGTGSARRTTD